jgi:hypothetical protein
MVIGVSACLLGENCKYNGGNNYSKKTLEYVKGGCGHKVGPDIEKYQEVYDVLIRTTKESRGIIFPV